MCVGSDPFSERDVRMRYQFETKRGAIVVGDRGRGIGKIICEFALAGRPRARVGKRFLAFRAQLDFLGMNATRIGI